MQENKREVIQRTFLAVQCSIVDLFLEPFRDRQKFMPVNQASFPDAILLLM